MQSVITLPAPIEIFAHAAAGGKEEFRGPLGKYLDMHDDSETFGQKTWERAEGELSHAVLALALNRAALSHADVSYLFSGDLQNQCVASSMGHLEDKIPFLGLYGACSTCTEALLLASLALSVGEEDLIAAAVTTSHNSVAERQFRTPIEYGGQRPPTAQWTTTAGGAFILRRGSSSPHIVRVMPGVMVDGGVTDAFNMGAAMAPAAAESIASYLHLTSTSPSDYDMIVTGDLGAEGSALLDMLLKEKKLDISSRHADCGCLIYDPRRVDCHAGGSGCGCSAAVLASYFLPLLKEGTFHRILFLSTGALMSTSSVQQGGTILGIAPVIELIGGHHA